MHQENNRKDLVELFLDNGANIEAKDVDGFTALLKSSKVNAKETAKLLIDRGANIEAINNER